MATKQQATGVILWIARILAILEIGFILFFLLADLLNGDSGGEGLDSLSEFIDFAFFPVMPLIGLLLALKWPALGGMISTLGFVGLSVVRPDLISDPTIMVLAIPGILFLVAWILGKRSLKSVI
ncbi:MAG: hypothetical protein HKN00_12395 [Flavobacteriaceae bacterium]|nr:hypothetical protein [Bacteroidia bacterium]MBT8268263.1 hypothetical protein [Bacteroidia bacterium]NNF75981.1 hypothetical protein [Flavobacteriaceae bacterium]NNK70308.1 hypothetical protein [Flavobacteriaceae bacterium]NNL81103.1 hypothetical protein [Flavobacteriaceae bacterium]